MNVASATRAQLSVSSASECNDIIDFNVRNAKPPYKSRPPLEGCGDAESFVFVLVVTLLRLFLCFKLIVLMS